MKKFFSIAITLLIVAFMACLIVYPDRYLTSTLDGIKLWAFSVLPSLLPFFFLTTLLTKTASLDKLSKKATPLTKKLYNCSGITLYAQIMSILSGYPIGAKVVSDLYQKKLITKDEATRASTFCSTTGPLFIVGSVGISMFQNKKIGLIFLITHILSSIFCGFCFKKYGDNRTILDLSIKKETSDNLLYDCIYQSVISVLIVGGFVSVFYTLSQILHDFNVLFVFEKLLSPLFGKNFSVGFIQGIVECTKGCKILSLDYSILSASLSLGLISFGGFSIICQSIVFLKKAEVNIKIFLLSKLVQMIFSIVVCFLLLTLFL